MAALICLGIIAAVCGALGYMRWQETRHVPFHPWRYCPWCRAKLELGTIDGKEKRKCTKCKFVHWDNPRPVAITLIPTLDNGGLILIRRLIEPRIGKVALPGGFVEPYEELHVAAAREVEEEIGIKVEIERQLCVLMPPGVNEHLHFFLAKPTDQTPVKSAEAEPFIADRDSIPADIAFQTHKQVIEDWLAATAL